MPTRDLLNSTHGIAVVNDTFVHQKLIRNRKVWFTPPPVDLEEFTSAGPSARTILGVAEGTPLFGVIGKIAPERGFEQAFEAFSGLRATVPSARLLVVGEGTHRPELERISRSLGIADSVIWAGYHEQGLAAYYRAMDAMFFTAPGSDEGHRAVLEAMACGTPVVSFPIDGMTAVLGSLSPVLISPRPEPRALGSTAAALFLEGKSAELRTACVTEAVKFGFTAAASRLERLYDEVAGGPRNEPERVSAEANAQTG